MGRSASAASAAVSMLVMLCALRARGGEDDEIGDEVREDHPNRRIDRHARELGTAAMTQDLQRPPRMRSLLPHFFNLLRGLPEEGIGAKGRAKDGDDHEEITVIQQDGR